MNTPQTPPDEKDLTAGTKQLAGAIRETAHVVRTFYLALWRAGFSKEEAFALAHTYLTAMLSRPLGSGKEE